MVAKYKDFKLRLLPQEYSDYAEGQIFRQEPAGGEKVQRGSDVWITVSMGPEPPKVALDNVIGAEAEEACELLEDKGFKTLKKKESSYIYEAGQVTRTDPAAGTELRVGETVYVYISTGKEVVEATMPNVVGLEVDRAMELMTQLGFSNVRYEEVESRKPAGQVIYQSVNASDKIDATAEVIIHYSQGPQETTAPTETTPATQPSIPQETNSGWTVTFSVPERDSEYRLDICLAGTKDILASKMIAPGSTSTYVLLSGTGSVAYDLYIDGEYYDTDVIEFTKES